MVRDDLEYGGAPGSSVITAMPDDLALVLRRTRFLLLDFDGPICAIFAGRPAPLIARRLADDLASRCATLPASVRRITDPFDVLRLAATLGANAMGHAEARLREEEIAAVATARATPHAEALIETWTAGGRRVAAVSNNSQAAVANYLARHDLHLDLIVGRTNPDPALLKPSPHLILRALEGLDADPDEALLVGDSPSDVAAGASAGLRTIGFANKPGKAEKLSAAGAFKVVRSLADLVLR